MSAPNIEGTTNPAALAGGVFGTIIKGGSAPATAAAAGTTGQIVLVDGFIYVCVSTNTWQRVAIATW